MSVYACSDSGTTNLLDGDIFRVVVPAAQATLHRPMSEVASAGVGAPRAR